MARLPSQNLLDKTPWIPESGLCRILFEQFRDRARVNRGLPQWREPQSLQQARGDDKTYGLDMVQPLQVGIAIDFRGHGDHPETGQR